jgi:hypothetical protein
MSRAESYFANRFGGQKMINVINASAALASASPGRYLTGTSGTGAYTECSNENAWSSIFVWGVLDGATVKFQLGAVEEAFFDYPAPTSLDGPNCYPSAGITAAGFYYFDRLLGNNLGRIIWSGAGANANFWVAATQQVV